jgi:hypothetical protein
MAVHCSGQKSEAQLARRFRTEFWREIDTCDPPPVGTAPIGALFKKIVWVILVQTAHCWMTGLDDNRLSVWFRETDEVTPTFPCAEKSEGRGGSAGKRSLPGPAPFRRSVCAPGAMVL